MTRRAWLLWLAWFLMLAMAAASLWCADPSVLPADTPVTPAPGAIAASPAASEAVIGFRIRLGDRDASCEPLERLTRGWHWARGAVGGTTESAAGAESLRMNNELVGLVS